MALCRSCPNGFSMTTRLQRPLLWPGQSGLLQLLAHHRERLRRDRQVERVVAAGAAFGVELFQRLGQPAETPSRRRMCPVRTGSPRPAGPTPPGETVCGRAPLPRRGRPCRNPRRPSPVGRSRPARSRRQQAAVGQVVDRRHQLLAGQIAGHAEDHHAARTRDSRHPLVALVAQWITPVGSHFFAASS